jgi:hypothetical protein
MKLFTTGKVGVFCDAIKHHNETRKSGDTKVITLTCRVEPFDVKLATSMAQAVRTTLFKLNHPDPQPHIRRCDFVLGLERQQLHVFASSDTKDASIVFDQVRISRTYARTQKDSNGYTLVFDATFGPVGKSELAYVEGWRGTQRSVTFEAAEPDLDFEVEADDDGDEDADAAQPGLLAKGTCTHGCAVGEACEDCAGGIALAPPPTPKDEREAARTPARRHPDGKKPQGARRPTTH